MGTGVRSDARVVAANIPKILVFGGIAATALCFPVGLISPLLAQETVPLARVAFLLLPLMLPISWLLITYYRRQGEHNPAGREQAVSAEQGQLRTRLSQSVVVANSEIR
jgi:hypothetical protein